jgi:hypothetical protein
MGGSSAFLSRNYVSSNKNMSHTSNSRFLAISFRFGQPAFLDLKYMHTFFQDLNSRI